MKFLKYEVIRADHKKMKVAIPVDTIARIVRTENGPTFIYTTTDKENGLKYPGSVEECTAAIESLYAQVEVVVDKKKPKVDPEKCRHEYDMTVTETYGPHARLYCVHCEQEHPPREHEFYDREDGLKHCRICNGAESTLPTYCPGRKLTKSEEAQIQDGDLDFGTKHPHFWDQK